MKKERKVLFPCGSCSPNKLSVIPLDPWNHCDPVVPLAYPRGRCSNHIMGKQTARWLEVVIEEGEKAEIAENVVLKKKKQTQTTKDDGCIV